MVTSALSVYFLLHLAFLAWSFTFDGPTSLRLWFLRVMLIAMCYDNLMLMLGDIGVGTEWYVMANYPRFVLHAAVLPFLTLFTLSVAQHSRVAFASNIMFIRFCWVFTALAWVYGVWHEVVLLELEPAQIMDHSRLVSVSKLPPLATIATNILILAIALAIWRRAGWLIFFGGALFIFLLNGSTGSQPWGFIAGNGAEVIFICCLLLTERFVIRTINQETM
jgi:hypothetical protein